MNILKYHLNYQYKKYLFYIWIYFINILNFQQTLFQALVSHYPSGINLIYRFSAQETFLILTFYINVENSCVALCCGRNHDTFLYSCKNKKIKQNKNCIYLKYFFFNNVKFFPVALINFKHPCWIKVQFLSFFKSYWPQTVVKMSTAFWIMNNESNHFISCLLSLGPSDSHWAWR